MSTKEKWVQVESESELRPGPVRTLPSKRIAILVLRVDLPMDGAWKLAETPDDGAVMLTMDVRRAISDHALYRLSDLTDDSETTDATKELVTT